MNYDVQILLHGRLCLARETKRVSPPLHPHPTQALTCSAHKRIQHEIGTLYVQSALRNVTNTSRG
jgi:hypothetical protein